MTILRIVLVGLLCIPVLYISFALLGKLIDESIKKPRKLQQNEETATIRKLKKLQRQEEEITTVRRRRK